MGLSRDLTLRVVLAIVIAVLGNLALYFYLQQFPSSNLAQAPEQNSPIIVVK